MGTSIPDEVVRRRRTRTLALTVLILIAAVFSACGSAGVQSAETDAATDTDAAADTAQIRPHSCIDELVAVLVPGHVEGTAQVTTDLQAALADGPITLTGEIADDIFRTNDGLVIEIQPGSVECDLDGGY